MRSPGKLATAINHPGAPGWLGLRTTGAPPATPPMLTRGSYTRPGPGADQRGHRHRPGRWRTARRFPAVIVSGCRAVGLPRGGTRVVRGGCTSLGAHPGSKRRLAWSRDCDDYEGMVVALLLIAAIAAVWWLVGRKGWGVVQKVVFWVVLLAILWVVVTRYSAPHPGG